MYLRRCLSIASIATLAACGVGVSGLQSVGQKPSDHGGSPAPPSPGGADSDDGGAIFGNDDPPDGGPAHDGAGSVDRSASHDASADHVDESPFAASSLIDAEVVDLQTIGCPDKAACPAGQVCCAQFQDGSFILSFDDAGAIETSCQSSCTAGTSPLCSADTDCGDAGGLCFKDPPTSARGFCTGSVTPAFPTFPFADGGVP